MGNNKRIGKTLILDFPPTVNNYYAVVRGRKLLSATGRQFKASVLADVKKEYAGEPLKGRLSVHISLHRKDRRPYDIQNFSKALLDALEDAGVYENDSQIDELEVVRGAIDHSKVGFCVVYIEVIDEQA